MKTKKWRLGRIDCRLQLIGKEYLLTAALFGKEILSESYKVGEFLPEYLMFVAMPKQLIYLIESWIADIEVENEQQTFQNGEGNSNPRKCDTKTSNRCPRCKGRRNDSKITKRIK